MGNLLLILLCLFLALGVLVFIAERYAKPLENQQQAKLSRILVFLIFVLLLLRVLDYYFF